MRLISLLSAIIILLGMLACVKDKEPNNQTKLNCNKLRVRKVIYHNFLNSMVSTGIPYFIEVQIENTCKSCDDNWVYLNVFMIDKTTQDTVARTPCGSCAFGVKNNTTGSYLLGTSLNKMPDLKNIRFSYPYLCNDVPYEPK